MRSRPAHFSGAFYHVMLRGNRKQEIFRDDRDYRHLERLIATSLDRYSSEIHAYCWMPNHLHLLMRAHDVPLHRTIHYFAMMYAKYFNFRYGLVGHLFQGRYKSRLVDSDAYFLQLLRYIHLNPVRGNLVDRVELFPWSSIQTYLNLANSTFLNQSVALQYFGRDRDRFFRFVCVCDESFEPWSQVGPQIHSVECTPPYASNHATEVWGDFDEVVSTACEIFATSSTELRGPEVRRDLALARCWIGREALRSNVATLSATAKYLNRSPAALSKSIKTNADRLAKVKG